MKCKEWGRPWHAIGDILVSIIRNNIIYGLGWGSERFLRYKAFYKVNGVVHVGHTTGNFPVHVTEYVSS